MLRNLFTAGLFCLSATVFSGTVAAAQDIGGRYSVAGTNINGTTYGGEAVITLTSDTTCQIEWITGDTSSFGICMRYDNAFAAGYQQGDYVGLAIYLVMADGSLNGTWTVAGEQGSGTEVLVPM